MATYRQETIDIPNLVPGELIGIGGYRLLTIGIVIETTLRKNGKGDLIRYVPIHDWSNTGAPIRVWKGKSSTYDHHDALYNKVHRLDPVLFHEGPHKDELRRVYLEVLDHFHIVPPTRYGLSTTSDPGDTEVSDKDQGIVQPKSAVLPEERKEEYSLIFS